MPFLIASFGAIQGHAQQSISFSIDGYTYQADINWIVKHNRTNYQGKVAHALDRSVDPSVDLVVLFKFRYDSIPGDQNLVWGFQFSEEGGLLTPTRNDKRSRSLKLFQRFQLTGTGNASLLISPKVWRKSSSNQFNIVTLAEPFKLNFNISEGAVTALNGAPVPDSLNNKPVQTIPSSTASSEAESIAYNLAIAESESTQKIKALMNFVDKFSTAKTSSPLVTEAIKNVPLATSLPVNKEGKRFSYTLNYAVNPVIDTSSVRGWRWTLSESDFGRYQLILDDIGDSVHSFKIADLGKNAPFNQPREIRPFDKIQVTLEGEDRNSFWFRLEGGVPPFIVFLSQNQIPKARYVINYTDTLWTIPKSSCKLCKSGPHTLEVYDNDFTTLLLRADKAIHITRINYIYLGLLAVAILLIIYFSFKPLKRARDRYLYEKRLRDIEAWEEKD
jgi:hypothetical protein